MEHQLGAVGESEINKNSNATQTTIKAKNQTKNAMTCE